MAHEPWTESGNFYWSGESLAEILMNGIAPWNMSGVVRGTESVERGEQVPGRNPEQCAQANTAVHHNLYRISLP